METLARALAVCLRVNESRGGKILNPIQGFHQSFLANHHRLGMAAGFRFPSAPTPPLLTLLVLVFSCFLMLFPVTSRADYSCPNSKPAVRCGRIDISYPFWLSNEPNQISPYCGYQGFMLTCQNNEIPILLLGDHNYRVLCINYTETVVTLADDDIFGPGQDPLCPRLHQNVTLPSNVFLSYADTEVTFFFNCSDSESRWPNNEMLCLNFTSYGREFKHSYVFLESPDGYEPFPIDCSEVVVWPILKFHVVGNNYVERYAQILQEGFQLHWTRDTDGNCSDCENSGGRCGYNKTDNGTLVPACFCSDGEIDVVRCTSAYLTLGAQGRKKPTALIIGIVIGALVAVALLCVSIFFCRYKKKRNYLTASKTFTRSASSGPSSRDPETHSLHFQTKVFSYNELQEATNGFDKELGDGGFGTVYKGKLRDGRVVAVKRLYENNDRRLEQYVNEIEILSRVRHQNLVDLYGWTSRDSKELLLVYEFVPNGTVADHLHGSRAREGILTWPMRLRIAIEAAEALAYLHAIDPPIIHRDVKTSNILLDSSFHVKVADFGLSRSFPSDATHVSTMPQGTPGYLDPEYHQCYQLTHKSDVYSFGVVLTELLSSKPAVDFTRHRREINLANMALNRIQNGELDQLVDEYLGYQSNQAARKTVTMVAEVAFRCLQFDGDMRPPMKEVLEALMATHSEGYKVSNGGKESGDNEDDAGLLQNIAPMSPDTVMNQWISSSNTQTLEKNRSCNVSSIFAQEKTDFH